MVTTTLPTAELSPREHQVVRLVAYGHTNREIGLLIRQSTKTVESYRGRALAKLGIRTRADLVAYALRTGMIRCPHCSED